MNTMEGKHLPVVHCVKGTQGWEINDKVAAALGDAKIIDKPTFGSLDLVEEVKKICADEDVEIEMIGLCTDICVVSNALLLKAGVPNVEVSVDSACCAGVTPDSHNAALSTLGACQVNVN